MKHKIVPLEFVDLVRVMWTEENGGHAIDETTYHQTLGRLQAMLNAVPAVDEEMAKRSAQCWCFYEMRDRGDGGMVMEREGSCECKTPADCWDWAVDAPIARAAIKAIQE